jgi:thiamine biosynthesis lipoprotein
LTYSQVRFPAFGSTATVAVAGDAGLDAGRPAVERVVDAFDRACSRFRHDSELSVVNGAAGTAVSVGPLLLDAVEAALRAARLTDGDVDPTVGQALVALGYDRDFESVGTVATTVAPPPVAAVPAPPRVAVAPPRIATVPGWRTVQVDREARTIRVPNGVRLDLGATAKALAADRAAAAAADAAGCGVLVSLGGDIAIAGPAPPVGWRVRVTDDHRAGTDAPGQWIVLRSGGLATSSTTVRRWRTSAGETHHLVDPRTASPAASVWRTVSVTAATCLDANIASTASIIRGERALPWLRSLGLPSRLVAVDGTVVHVGAWPAEGDDLLGAP